ncbi:MAG: hypothetical protein AAFV19_21825 [Pseudomonadota bacterium]
MRAFLLIPALLAVAACSQAEVESYGFKKDRVVESSGAYKIVEANGVCYEVDETAEDNEAPLRRINPARCGL